MVYYTRTKIIKKIFNLLLDILTNIRYNRIKDR